MSTHDDESMPEDERPDVHDADAPVHDADESPPALDDGGTDPATAADQPLGGPVEDPAVEDPVVEDPAVEDPAVEDPAVEDPAVEDPAVEDPAAEGPAIEDPAVEDPAAEAPMSGEPLADEPVTGEPPVDGSGAADDPMAELVSVDGVDATRPDPDVADHATAGDGTAADAPSDSRAVLFTVVGLTVVLVLAGLAFAFLTGGAEPAYTVNGEEVSREALVERLDTLTTDDLAQAVTEPEAAPPEQRAQLAQILSGFIAEALLEEEAEETDVAVTEEDIDEELQRIIDNGFGGDQAAFEQAIAASGLTEEGVRQQVRTTVLVEAIAGGGEEDEVAEEDIEAAYEAQFATGSVSHILVETEEEAEDVIARLEDGESFADLAMELSLDPGSGAAGGDLGPFQPGAFVPEFEEAVLETEPGEITGPVETQFGFHVITVTEPPALEAVRGDIIEVLQGQNLNVAIQELLTRLDEEATVTVDPALGEWVGLTQGGVLPPQADPADLATAPAGEGAPPEAAPPAEPTAADQ